jgi:hypothetical protein
LVVFGSVARREVTSSSDLDWILFIDGQSVPEHKNQERDIEKVLASAGYIEPGKSGVFGKMVGSHDLVHNTEAKTTSIQTPLAAFCFCSNRFRWETAKPTIAYAARYFGAIWKTTEACFTAAAAFASRDFFLTTSRGTGGQSQLILFTNSVLISTRSGPCETQS